MHPYWLLCFHVEPLALSHHTNQNMASFLHRQLTSATATPQSATPTITAKPTSRLRIPPSKWGKLIHYSYAPGSRQLGVFAPRQLRLPRAYRLRGRHPTTKLTFIRSLIDAKNKVPEHQRFYQQAYKAHTRVWMIVRTD